MNQAVPTIAETAEELKTLLTAERDGKRAQRLQMLYRFASKQVKARKEAATLLGVHRETLGDWLALYETGGREGLLKLYVAPGKAPGVTPEVEAQLREALSTPSGFASYGEVQEWLWQNQGIGLAYSTPALRCRRRLR